MNNQVQGPLLQLPPVHQWRITFYEDDGLPPLEEVFTGYFCAAWAISFPHPDEDGYDWQILKKDDLQARFDAGENNITASWVSNSTYTVIEKLAN